MSWSEVTPQLQQPTEVTKAVREAERLQAVLAEARQEVAASASELERATQADTAAMASALREGREAESDVAAVESARAALAAAERRAEAAAVALKGAERDLGAAVVATRAEWHRRLVTEAERQQRAAAKALDQLQQAVTGQHELEAVATWTESIDGSHPRPAQRHGLPRAASSSRITMNGEPLRFDQLISYMHEIVDPRPETIEQSTAAA